MSFADIRAAAFYDTILAEGNPGVEIVVVIENGVQRTVWCKRSSQDEATKLIPLPAPLPAGHGEQRKEKVFLRFGRNESHEKGGVANPRVGLAVIRGDDTERPWAYTGDVDNASAHSHTLTFARPITTKSSAR